MRNVLLPAVVLLGTIAFFVAAYQVFSRDYQYLQLVKLGEEWARISGGEVELVLYPGGVQGDESDVIRKMRIGQLHGGGLSVNGLTDLVDFFSVL